MTSHATSSPGRPGAATTRRWAIAAAVAGFFLGLAGFVGVVVAWALDVTWRPRAAALSVVAGIAAATGILAWAAGGPAPPTALPTVAGDRSASTLLVVGVVLLARAALVENGGGSASLSGAVSEVGAALRRWTAPTSQAGRRADLSWLKAIAILVVIAIHAMLAEFAPTDAVTRWAGDLTRFAVPTFLFVSGLLVGDRPAGRDWLRGRLARILGPYLVASLLAFAVRAGASALPPATNPLLDLLVGAAFGPYYYVFVLVVLTLATPVLVRVPPWLRLGLLVAAVAVQVPLEGAAVDVAVKARNPLVWAGFYLGGMLVSSHQAEVRRHRHLWPLALAAWAAAAVVMALAPPTSTVHDVATVVGQWTAIAWLWLWALTRSQAPAAVWWLDRATYPLYLVHVPIVMLVAGAFGAPLVSVRAWTGFLVGVAASVSLVVVAQHLLPERRRILLGA